MNDLICYQFSRDRVEAGDAKDFLSRFGKFRVPVGKQLSELALFEVLLQLWKYPPRGLHFNNLSPSLGNDNSQSLVLRT